MYIFIYFHLEGDSRHLSPPASVFSLLLRSGAPVLGLIYESPAVMKPSPTTQLMFPIIS